MTRADRIFQKVFGIYLQAEASVPEVFAFLRLYYLSYSMHLNGAILQEKKITENLNMRTPLQQLKARVS